MEYLMMDGGMVEPAHSLSLIFLQPLNGAPEYNDDSIKTRDSLLLHHTKTPLKPLEERFLKSFLDPKSNLISAMLLFLF